MHTFFEKINIFNNILFDEKYHKYTIDGKPTISVTKVTGMPKPPFDEMKVSKRSARKQLIEDAVQQLKNQRGNPDYIPTDEEMLEINKSITQYDIELLAGKLRTEWKLTNRISTEKGSAVHKYIESAMAQKFERYPEASIRSVFGGTDPVKEKYDICIDHVNTFMRTIKGKMYPVKSELVIGSPKYLVCGMIDQIFYNVKSGKFEIWDWKTNSEFDTESEYYHNDPIAHVPTSKLDEYSLQLACYKQIFQEMTGIELGKSYLCWFSELQPSFKIFECKPYEAEANILLNTYGNKG